MNELLKRALEAHAELKSGGLPAPAIAVVVNRVARARTVFEELKRRLHSARDGKVDTILMIGPARPVDRDDLTGKLEPIRTGSKRRPEKPLMIVATQCIEAGVDIDLDGLVTEAAPLDALRQRFGRLNRAGREFSPYAEIVCHPKKDAEDPVYGNAITEAWSLLAKKSHKASAKTSDPIVDFGLKAFAETVPSPLPNATLAPKLDAPILLPAHLDLLTQTSPVPNADPEVSLYLHGPNRTVDAVTVVWREDVDPEISLEPEARRLLVMVPPRSAEAIELPVWAVRRWLTAPKASFPELSDIPGDVPDESGGDKGKRVFLWAGDDERSRWVAPKEIRSGSTIVVPTHYGGVDRYGWNPQFTEPAVDVADTAAQAYAGRRFAVRVAPQLFDNQVTRDKLAAAIANADPRDWRDVRDAVIDVVTAEAGRLRNYLSGAASTSTFARVRRLEAVGAALADLEAANAGKGRKTRVDVYADVYGQDEDQRSRGVVFIAPLGITATFQTDETEELSFQISTEDDVAGSVAGYPQLLREHSEAVKAVVERFALSAGLPENRVADLSVAAYLHDSGKSDARFQSWLAHGDPLGPGPDKVLAKSGRQLPPQARTQSGLPEHWRHEALSVRLAPLTGRFQTDVKDQELVLWLIGTHHGHGRPFFPHRDPLDEEIRTNLPSVLGIPATLPLGPGPQSFAYDWNGMDWAALYERLKARYGVWELARMEAVLRLGDHRASEQTLVEGIIR